MTLEKHSGFGYFFYGAKLAMAPGLRRYVMFPLLINFILIGGALAFLFNQMGGWIDGVIGLLPDMLSWLSYVLWPLISLVIVVIFMYYFSTLANIIAAPFSGLLAEKVEQKLLGIEPKQESLTAFFKDIPRILAREWRKLVYTIPKMIGLFILLFIPVIGQTVGPFAWFIFTSWMFAIQYCDYPFDNNKVDFITMRDQLKQKKGCAYGFGVMVTLFTTVPVVNMFVLPIAVCGATAMWVTEFRQASLR
ncbi:sulfate transporter CysZ [Vibrio sp. WJH972]